MCLRFGADEGRGFLANRDPVPAETPTRPAKGNVHRDSARRVFRPADIIAWLREQRTGK